MELLMIGEKIKSNAETFTTTVKRSGKRSLVICASVLIIAAAVCVNWALFAGANSSVDDTPTGGEGDVIDTGNGNASGADDAGESVASYFASVQISRQQARDEALEVLQMVIASDSALESAKNEAIENVNRIADEITAESNIETLVVAKGFEDCVAVISDGSASIVVKSSGLLPSEIAQIMEIVYEQADIVPSNVRIIEKY